MAKSKDSKKNDPDIKAALRFEKAETAIPSLYVNNAQFSMTEWDIRIDLGELQHTDPDKLIQFIAPKLRLIFNPRFARRFSIALNSIIEQREKVEAETQKLATELDSKSAE